KVWSLIEEIPFGETRTYGTLAKQLGNSNLARAVGNACNKNPVALLIPCHRVVGKNNLGGFAGGSEIKEQLLKLER
ncbi:MAG: MGMT family protein, partial [Desulfobulbaceae bacterium]|nr:MGMT family protein [Desulfobulbaceae bacterium]